MKKVERGLRARPTGHTAGLTALRGVDCWQLQSTGAAWAVPAPVDSSPAGEEGHRGHLKFQPWPVGLSQLEQHPVHQKVTSLPLVIYAINQ